MGNIRICIRYLQKSFDEIEGIFLFIKEKTHFYRKNLLLFISCSLRILISLIFFTRRYPVRDEGRREKTKCEKQYNFTNFSKFNFQKNIEFLLGLLISILSRFLLFSWPQFCWSKENIIDQTGYCPNSGSCNAIQMLAQGGISVSGGF